MLPPARPYLQIGVLLNLLTDQDDSGRGQGVSGVSGQRPVLLGLAINDRGHGVPLHADAQPVPAVWEISWLCYIAGAQLPL